jgi:hypothetical protein
MNITIGLWIGADTFQSAICNPQTEIVESYDAVL